MFDQTKVVLIGCLAAFACLLDNFLPSIAGESSVYRHAVDAPQPVRFPLQRDSITMVRPVPPTKEQLAELERTPRGPVCGPFSEIDFWMKDLQQRILTEWAAHRGKNEHVVVQFKVAPDGKVSDVRIIKSSGILKTDDDAIRSITRASPFRPLRCYGETGETEQDVQFTFDDTPKDNRSLPRNPTPRNERVEY